MEEPLFDSTRMSAPRKMLSRILLAALSLGILASVSSCREITEVVVVVNAEDAVKARATFVGVRIYDTEGALVVDRIDPLGDALRFPLRLPLTPRSGARDRTWRVEVRAETAFACVLATLSAEGVYADGAAVEESVILTHTQPDPCPLGPGCENGCDDGNECTVDSCVEQRCLNTVTSDMCVIDDACIASSERDPSEACRACDPTRSARAWSIAPGCDFVEVVRLTEGAAPSSRHADSLAMSNGWLIAGVPTANSDSGQAFVFRLSAEGTWEADGELLAREIDEGGKFGTSVAVSGDWALVGAPVGGSGRAFMFRRTASGWSPDQELSSATLVNADRFGAAVAMDGDLALVGATHAESPLGESGAVWVFRRSAEDRWVEVERVTPPVPQASAFFGSSIAISGDRFVVGSPFFEASGLRGAGVAYAYQLDGDVVSSPVPLNPNPDESSSFFGTTVAIRDRRVAVTATQHNIFANDAGAVFVFELAGEVATPIAALGMGPAGGQAGTGLAFTEHGFALGFPTNAGGFVTLFEGSDSDFVGLPRITPDSVTQRGFGADIATWDRWMAVAASRAESDSETGAVFVYELRR